MKLSQTDLDLSGAGVQMLNRKRDLFLESLFWAQEVCKDVFKSVCGLVPDERGVGGRVVGVGSATAVLAAARPGRPSLLLSAVSVILIHSLS